MALADLAQTRPAPPLTRPVELICIALAFAHVLYLAVSYVQGVWLVDPQGHGIATDFVNVWAAGKLVLTGDPAAAYDWPTHKAIEEAAVGHAFDGYFGWHYPPTFLFAAALLALLPYAVAYALWVFATFPLYALAVRKIVGNRIGYLLAAAFPAVLSNFVVGQNGFLTAGLIGGTLLCIERRPTLAGIFLGLLTYKPHLGLLFPVVLVAAGHWRVFFTAGFTAALLAIASWMAFGTTTWQAFFLSIGHTSQAFLSDGWADWSKLQTVFGVTRIVGGSEHLAWSLQAIVSVASAILVSLLWRQRLPFPLKAAALAAGAVIATPYLYTYDLVVLAIPLAFLFRLGQQTGFLRYEWSGIGLACLLIFSFPITHVPVGLAAALVVAALIAQRALGYSAAAHTG